MLGLAGELCTARYEEQKQPCSHCPIRNECHGAPGILTWDTLKKWQAQCNAAAAKHLGDTDGMTTGR